MKKLLLLSIIAMLFSYDVQTQVNSGALGSKVEKAVYGTQNYAVVWKWSTTDKDLVTENSPKISSELTNLWKKGIVENAYYNADAKLDKFEDFPNITFFLKAKSVQEAEIKLNSLTVVKKGIATYTIYPVGTLWLDRDADKINEKGLLKSYVTVWSTITESDNSNAKTMIESNVKAQNDAILKLWKDGVIENAYFDIEGTAKANQKTDFVFFVNAKTEQEAKAVCDNLPFVKKNIASYKLLSVGVHWLGKYKK